MEQLTIKKVLDLKTAKGDAYKKVDVMKADGTMVMGVSAFTFKYPNQAELVEGAIITAGIVIDGNYRNLVSATEKPKTGQNGAFKAMQIEKTMERKETSIGKFQDNKELSIKMASTMRMAVDMTIAMAPEQREGTFEETIRKWRQWFILEWENMSTDKPF